MNTSTAAEIFDRRASEITPTVSIVIPCRNEQDYIGNALKSILAQEPPEGDFEVIVADGMSDDGTREVLTRLSAEDPRLRIIDNPNHSIPAGLNSAIKAAVGEIIIRMDAHTEYAPDYVKQCVAVLHETSAANVGGPWIAKGEGFVGRAIAAAFQSAFAVGGARCHRPSYEGPLDTVYLGCWRAELLHRLEFFDEEFVRSEDDELNLRLTRTGGRIWQSPRIKSWYYPRESLQSLFQQQVQYGYWKLRVMQKHRIPASVRHVVPASFVSSLILLTMASIFWPLAGWSLSVLMGTYLACNVVASVLAAARADWRLLPLLPVVFACYHFAYGYGSLRGFCDFILFRRRPSSAYTELTRDSARNLRTSRSLRS